MTASPDQVRRARQAQRLSQEQLAALAGVSPRTIGRIERGENSDSRKRGAVEQALGIGEHANDEEPRLSAASSMQLLTELGERLSRLEQLEQQRRQLGALGRTGSDPAVPPSGNAADGSIATGE